MTAYRSAPDHAGRRRGRRRLALAQLATVAVLAFLALAAAVDAMAASPSPAASEPAFGPSNVEARLDTPLPTDAAEGDTIVVAFTTWDRQNKGFAEFGEGFVRLHAARGKADPVEATAPSNWPGHFIAEVAVPRGGVGAVDVGFRAQVCTASGTCTQRDVLFALAGVGPPPDAPLGLLVVANFDQPRPPIVAGDPIDLVVRIEAQAAWDIEGFGLPTTLVAFANKRGGPDLATADLHRTGDRGSRPGIAYAGQITLPEPGETSIQIAIPGNGTEDQVLGGIGVTVGGTAVTGSPRPTDPVATSTDGDVRWVLAAGVATLALLGGFVIRRVFADL